MKIVQTLFLKQMDFSSTKKGGLDADKIIKPSFYSAMEVLK